MANPQNLKPFTGADDPRRANGPPKGTRHLSTIIREIMENIDWSKTTLKNKEQLQAQYGKRGWDAMVYVAYTKAMTGDPQAMKFLAEHGFGKNIDITSGGEKLNVALVEFVGDDSDNDKS